MLIDVVISSFLFQYALNDWCVTFEEFVVLFLQKLEPQKLVSSALLKKREEFIYRTNLKKKLAPLARLTKSFSTKKYSQRYSQGKTMFYSFQYKNGYLIAFVPFHIFTESVKFSTFHYRVLKSTDVRKMWFTKQTLKTNGCFFQQVLQKEFGLVFVLNWKTLFHRGFIFNQLKEHRFF